MIRARHALAVDDERRAFASEFWNERGVSPGQFGQVWFAGVHSNIGGGYPKQGMSLVALDWMMAHAEAAGLLFIPAARDHARRQQDVHDKLYDSRSGLAVYYRWDPRDIAELCRAHGIERPRVHISVFECAPWLRPATGLQPALQARSGRHPRRGHRSLAGRREAAQDRGARPPDGGAGGAATSPLARNASMVWLGKLSYYVFLSATILILLGATCSPESADVIRQYAEAIPMGNTLAGAIEWARIRIGAICPSWSWKGFLVAFLLSAGLAWGMSHIVDRRLRREFTGFWHKRRDELRCVLD